MLNWNEILIRLLLASFFGALIGLERERKDWAAGMRTHMMVSVGSCLIMIVSSFGFSDILGSEHVGLDPSRVAAQVVSGIGFIGAGAILFSKQGTVRGLTTAAGLWTVAAIGLATGGGLYFAAGVTTIIALIILWALQPIEQLYAKKFKHNLLIIISSSSAISGELIRMITKDKNIKIQSFIIEKIETDFTYQIKFENNTAINIEQIIDEIKTDTTVKEVVWTK